MMIGSRPTRGAGNNAADAGAARRSHAGSANLLRMRPVYFEAGAVWPPRNLHTPIARHSLSRAAQPFLPLHMLATKDLLQSGHPPVCRDA